MSSSYPAVCIEIDEFIRRADTTHQVKEDHQSISVSHLHHPHASFNSKVTEMQEAATLLAEYIKKATESTPVNNGAIVDVIVATFAPVVNPSLGTNSCPKRKHTPSTRKLEVGHLI